MANIRYNIIPLQVTKQGQIIRFQHKIPNYLDHCTGFIAKHVKGVQTDLYLPEIGWLTLSFNNLKENAINAVVSAPAFLNHDDYYDYQQLNVRLLKGQLVCGVYVDTLSRDLFFPYKVNLYLRCKHYSPVPIQPQESAQYSTQIVTDIPECEIHRHSSFTTECNNDGETAQNHEQGDQLCTTI